MLINKYFRINVTKFKISTIRSNCYLSGLIDKYVKFDPIDIDGCCAEFWRFFEQNNEKKTVFSIIMPPPNVTGNLHIGHALSFTLQDTIIRAKRMKGYNTTWIPGFDHAGIATQIQVEKYLQRKHGKNWNSNLLSRKEFMSVCEHWSESKKTNISGQLKSLALSPNWDLEFFTLNQKHSHVVNQAFIELYKKHKIHRDNRIINWSCQLQSAISDIEIDLKEIKGETRVHVPGYRNPIIFGVIHQIAYKLESNNGEELVVATTRPETIPADMCLAVHPNDFRYSRFIGQKVRNPITRDLIPIVCDEEVDPDFGTGIIKVTPGHSITDFKIAKRHNIELKNIIDNHGNMVNVVGLNLAGIPRFTARDIIIGHLINQNLYRGCNKSHTMKLPICSRSDDVIEYLVRPQWFYDVSESCDKAIQAIHKQEIDIRPSGYTGEFLQFLEAKEHWCISRQLKWGHSIPAYFYKNLNQSQYFIDTSKEDIIDRFPSIDSTQLQLDTDVLDTWFSSSLLPLSVAGWPDKLNTLFPSSVLVTGHDIVPLWVCRMMIMSLELANRLPFKKVILHGMICDSHGRKMSKSRGNVIDPIKLIGTHLFDQLMPKSPEESINFQDMIDKSPPNVSVSKMGSDAVRLSLLEHYISGHQIKYDVAKAVLARNFMQKMWQSVRFVYSNWKEEEIARHRFGNLQDNFTQLSASKLDSLNHMQRWLLLQLAKLISVGNVSQDIYIYHPLCIGVREFWWGNLCSVFIEWAKHETSETQNKLNLELIMLSLNTCIHLIHPVIPQITEILWHSLMKEKVLNKSVGNELYPNNEMVEAVYSKNFGNSLPVVQKVLHQVSEINYWTKCLKLSKGKLKSSDSLYIRTKEEINEKHEILSRLTRVPLTTKEPQANFIVIQLGDCVELVINKELCDMTALEAGLMFRLKQFVATKNELTGKLNESKQNDSDIRQQLLELEDNIKSYENQVSSFQNSRDEQLKI